MEEKYEITEEDLWDEFFLEGKRIAVIKSPDNEFTFGEIKEDELIDLSDEDFEKAGKKYQEILELFGEK